MQQSRHLVLNLNPEQGPTHNVPQRPSPSIPFPYYTLLYCNSTMRGGVLPATTTLPASYRRRTHGKKTFLPCLPASAASLLSYYLPWSITSFPNAKSCHALQEPFSFAQPLLEFEDPFSVDPNRLGSSPTGESTWAWWNAFLELGVAATSTCYIDLFVWLIPGWGSIRPNGPNLFAWSLSYLAPTYRK